MESVQEIIQFLDLNARIELKSVALDSVLGLTASDEGQNKHNCGIPNQKRLNFVMDIPFGFKVKF